MLQKSSTDHVDGSAGLRLRTPQGRTLLRKMAAFLFLAFLLACWAVPSSGTMFDKAESGTTQAPDAADPGGRQNSEKLGVLLASMGDTESCDEVETMFKARFACKGCTPIMPAKLTAADGGVFGSCNGSLDDDDHHHQHHH